MREQQFGMYMPVLILILMEVVLMLRDSEGATASVAQRWSKRSSGDPTVTEPSVARYHWRKQSVANKIPTRGKKARINEKRINRSVSGNLRMKNQAWEKYNEAPITDDHVNADKGQPNIPLFRLPLKIRDSPTTSFAYLPDQSSLDINELMPGAISAVNKTSPNLDLHDREPKVDTKSSVIDLDSLLSQIHSLLKPHEDTSPLKPGSASDICETNPHLQLNDLGSLLDAQFLLNPILIQIGALLIPHEQSNPLKLNALQSHVVQSDITYAEEHPESIIDAPPDVNIVQSPMHYHSRFNSTTEPLEPPQPVTDAPPDAHIFESVLEHLDPFILSDEPQEHPQSVADQVFKFKSIVDYLEKPVNTVITPIKSVLDYVNPFKPTKEPPKPVTLVHIEPSPPQSMLDPFNPHRPATYPQAPPRPDISLEMPLYPIMDVLSPNKPVQKIFKERDESGPEIDQPKFFHPHINPIEAYTFHSNPMQIFGPKPDDSRLANDQPKLFRLINDDTDSSGSKRRHPRRPSRERNGCPNIPSDYHLLEDISRAYKFHGTNLNWDEAQITCKSEDAALALPENQQQYDLMSGYLEGMFDIGDIRFFAGFYRMSAEVVWTTVAGDSLPFEKWADDYTNDDLTDKLCGGILVSDNNSDGLTSENCAEPLPFMCEMIIPPECM